MFNKKLRNAAFLIFYEQYEICWCKNRLFELTLS